jgi:hypothetical protein
MGVEFSRLFPGTECRDCGDGMGVHASELQGCFKDFSCESNRQPRLVKGAKAKANIEGNREPRRTHWTSELQRVNSPRRHSFHDSSSQVQPSTAAKSASLTTTPLLSRSSRSPRLKSGLTLVPQLEIDSHTPSSDRGHARQFFGRETGAYI